MTISRIAGCTAALIILASAHTAHARAPRPMGDVALDPEMGALVHKEKARQQLLHKNDPNKRGLVDNTDDGCGNISINSNTQQRIGQPPGKQNVTVITGPVINAASCR
ncbi:MAG: hypothetical protein FWH56_09510 [Betaproteobacteria bacterium]|nr:hypothetical protein [Betaproteobacteria bacterium]